MKSNKSQFIKRAFPLLLIFALVSLLSGMGMVASKTAQATETLHNPTYNASTDTTTWDCVWFGNYWQSDTNGDGVADRKDAKEHIKWRVLSVKGDDVFLLADKGLDCQPYNEKYTPVTWETCTLRSWLNGYDNTKNDCGRDYTSQNFINNAFSVDEQAVINNTIVVNNNYPPKSTRGGKNTVDKVYLLSGVEANNVIYGFKSKFKYQEDFDDFATRVASNTAYAVMQGVDTCFDNESGAWWLRSPGDESSSAAFVSFSGFNSKFGADVNIDMLAVRPALHVTFSPSAPLSYAGTVCSDGIVTDADGTVQPPTVGRIVKDISSWAYYRITSTKSTGGTVSFLYTVDRNKKMKVPETITYAGKKYKVTAIAKKAFAQNIKLKTVVIGKNVKTIQKQAFANCEALSKVTVKSKVLSKIGKNAFKGTSKKLRVKVPKSLSKAKKKKYKKMFKGKGNKNLQVK